MWCLSVGWPRPVLKPKTLNPNQMTGRRHASVGWSHPMFEPSTLDPEPQCRCQANGGVQNVSTSWYHDSINVTVPTYEVWEECVGKCGKV